MADRTGEGPVKFKCGPVQMLGKASQYTKRTRRKGTFIIRRAKGASRRCKARAAIDAAAARGAVTKRESNCLLLAGASRRVRSGNPRRRIAGGERFLRSLVDG